MEYIIVEFEEDRVVFIDDQENGRTNECLRVPAGTHTFALGDQTDCLPIQVTCLVAGTSVLSPMIIQFGVADDQ